MNTYLDTVLNGELQELSAAKAGRNNTLFKVAARLYQFCEAGAWTHDEMTDMLAGAASATGLGRDEIRTTLKSAMRKAAGHPAELPTQERGARLVAQPQAPEACEPPAQAWRIAGAAFVLWAISQMTDAARDYLHSRGLTDKTIAAAQFGYNPATREASRSKWGLAPDAEYGDKFWLPPGIVIPSHIDGALWKIQIRRDEVRADQDRYKTVTGSANALYGAGSIQPGKPVVLVEGPFDAMAVSQVAGDLCGVVASGTSGARRVRWLGKLAQASEVLVSLDADNPGDHAAKYWTNALPNARRWRPYYADPAQMLQDGQDVRGWVAAGIAKHAPELPDGWRISAHGDRWLLRTPTGAATWHSSYNAALMAAQGVAI